MNHNSLHHTNYYPAERVENYKYAIRNIVAEAKKIEAQGRKVTYLNIGDPILYGFQPPEEFIEAKIRALRDGHNGYAPSTGVPEVLETIAKEAHNRGFHTTPDDIAITYGASEAADLILTALLEQGDEILAPCPSYPLYTAIITKLEAVEVPYHQMPESMWQPDTDEIESKITKRTRAIIVINPNNPTGALYPKQTLERIIEIARKHKLVVISDEVYHRLTYENKHIPIASLAGNDVPVFTIESVSKNYMAPGWRLGWMTITNAHLVNDLKRAIYKLGDARLCAPSASQYAVNEAIHIKPEYTQHVISRLRAQRDLTFKALNSIEGISCNKPEGAFYAMPKVDLQSTDFSNDEEYIIQLLNSTGILYVHGSGFGMDPKDGFFRLVFLPHTDTLEDVYQRVADFQIKFRESKLSTLSL